MSPYLLPDGNVLLALSGGRTSANMLREIIDANPDFFDRIAAGTLVVSFQNTGREMPETLDFVDEIDRRWLLPFGGRVVWLEYQPEAPRFKVVNHNSAARDGEPFEALIRKRKFLPNRVARFCTAEMKVHCSSRYLRSLGWDRWTNAIGIRADEPGRLNGGNPRERFTVWHPLAAAGVSKRDVMDFWQRQPFDLRLPNVGGKTHLGNCDGCFLKSEANLAALAREHPERHAWWERMEALASEISAKAAGDGAVFSPRYSRRQLRQDIERMGPGLFSDDAYLCQKDDGECFG